ncbi:DUF2232 domain-containing protein [Cohnella sp. CFH 77786]|uniref:DUF2232 domain-containing protein n=1 Tax=Cohnella sp. CFH 77786 TaxID=2662265 RepID=UPI001C609C63|nr:DUF2232 domain-containing protein [Cohnella sp. CFH 77786]
MNNSWKSLVWSVMALAVLLSVPTPLNAITLFLLMTPLVVLFTMLKPLAFAGHAAAIGAAAFILSGSAGPLALTLLIFFLVPSIVMGYLYKKRRKARTVILSGFIVLLAQLLIELVLFSLQFRIDLAAELASLLKTSLMQFETGGMFPAGWAADTATELGEAIVTMLPLLLILSSFLFTIVTHGLTRLALKRGGIEIPGLPQAKTWRLPRSLVWYYLIALVVSFAVPEKGTGYWTVVTANLVPLLQYAFTVQAIGFFFFLADAKKWSKGVPVLISVLLVLFTPIFPFYLIGLLDAAFPLRRYFVK